MKSELINELLSLPESIATIELSIIDMNKVLRSIEDEIIDKEVSIKSDINAALDENNKKLYSNDQARQFAFLNEAKENLELQDLYESKEDIETKIKISKIDLEKLSNHQRNIRSVINLIED
jgi:hypothetical protein